MPRPKPRRKKVKSVAARFARKHWLNADELAQELFRVWASLGIDETLMQKVRKFEPEPADIHVREAGFWVNGIGNLIVKVRDENGVLYEIDFTDLAADVLNGAAILATNNTGTTTTALADVFTDSHTDGIHGHIALRNTGGSFSLAWELHGNNFFGDGPLLITSGSTGPGVTDIINTDHAGGGVAPPFTTITLKVQSAVAGNHTTYSSWRSMFV